MGNGIDSPELEGATPLELALDRATEQYMATVQERRGRARSAARASTTTAMVVAGEETFLPARLSWRGIEVTEEFQDYAQRVSRGEQLEPFRGQVLARPCPEFPWSAPANAQHEHTSTESLPHFRSRGPRVAAWLFGIGALVMAGLGIGSGTATNPDDDLDPFVLPPTTTALALRPKAQEVDRASDMDDLGIASAIESALAHAVPSEGDEPRAARARTSAGLGLPAPSAPRLAAAAAPLAAVRTSASLPPSAISSATASPALASTSAPAEHTPATPSDPSTSAALATAATGAGPMPAAPTHSSALFSDSPSF